MQSERYWISRVQIAASGPQFADGYVTDIEPQEQPEEKSGIVMIFPTKEEQ